MGGRGARMRLKIELGLALGIGLVLGGIFLRGRLAGLDLIVVVEHWPRRRLYLFRCRIHHQSALPG